MTDFMKSDPESGLRAVMRALALEPAGQIALYPERGCPTCALYFLYPEWLKRSEANGYVDSLAPDLRAAVVRLVAAVQGVRRVPCGEPERLADVPFNTLRGEARSALEVFGWEPGEPDCRHLFGREEFGEILRAENEQKRKERIDRRSKRRKRGFFEDIPKFDPRTLTVEGFLASFDHIPWFANLGQPHKLDRDVDRIQGWDEWVGPETLGGMALNQEGVAWRDALAAEASDGAAMEAIFAEAEKRAAEAIRSRIDFETDGDAWHGPSAAAGSAAWFAATLAGYRSIGKEIPASALRQWAWYARGHWPCHYSEDDDFGDDSDIENWPDLAALERARLVVL